MTDEPDPDKPILECLGIIGTRKCNDTFDKPANKIEKVNGRHSPRIDYRMNYCDTRMKRSRKALFIDKDCPKDANFLQIDLSSEKCNGLSNGLSNGFSNGLSNVLSNELSNGVCSPPNHKYQMPLSFESLVDAIKTKRWCQMALISKHFDTYDVTSNIPKCFSEQDTNQNNDKYYTHDLQLSPDQNNETSPKTILKEKQDKRLSPFFGKGQRFKKKRVSFGGEVLECYYYKERKLK